MVQAAPRTFASAAWAVAGVRLGGYVALEMIRQAPDRIDRIALFGTRASMATRARTVGEQRLLASAPHADPTPTPIVSGAVQAMAERVGSDVFERQQQALLAGPDRICRVEDARALADRIPGARLHILRNCHHLAPMERPGEVTMLLRDWLGETGRA